ncbi:hypothetical protein [Polaromonas sp.]|uniref:hypothetical protein n=1 Tax=Polaromonas sp. TaxID=1869339 RepID=UPI00286B1BFA|nr:hypothetical protein [Polaromonas sp.]
MPRFHAINDPLPPLPTLTSGDSRKAIEQRAREAAMPPSPAQKGRWPFPVVPVMQAGPAPGVSGPAEPAAPSA